jgi:hypothetical protein
MKTKSVVTFFTLPVDADVKSKKNYEKKLEQYQDYSLILMTIRFFITNFSSNH